MKREDPSASGTRYAGSQSRTAAGARVVPTRSGSAIGQPWMNPIPHSAASRNRIVLVVVLVLVIGDSKVFEDEDENEDEEEKFARLEQTLIDSSTDASPDGLPALPSVSQAKSGNRL